MPRTPEEIEAEIEALKEQGVHHNTKERKALREELKEARATENPPPPVAQPQAEFSVDVSPAPASEVPENPFQSDEWRFLEQCCAGMIPRKVASPAKDIYNELVAKRTAWVIAREIIEEIGTGARNWPQFKDLNRRADTGEKIADYEARIASERVLEEAAKSAAEPVPDPKPERRPANEPSIRVGRGMSPAGEAALANMAQQIQAQIGADMASRPSGEPK